MPMNARLIAFLLFLCGSAGLVSTSQAQVIEFRSTIDAAQEPNSSSTSTATGTAILLYDMTANTFDLFVTLNNVTNTITLSHIHEAAAGVNGPVVTNLGSEAVYTRSGSTVTGAFRGVVHGGSKLTLLRNGAYLNFHSAQFTGGEIRGQLIAQPKRLTAIITPSQEVAASPVVSGAFGAAVMSYNPGTNRMNLQITLFNFTNTLAASHFHEAPAGVNGPVVTNLGGAAAYSVNRPYITQTFNNLDYGTADPIRLLTGGAYLNFHSNVHGGGEIRGQVRASEEAVPMSRLINASVRGFAGTGNQVLIAGLGVTGNEPVAVRIVGRGPSLAAYGVQGALADPAISLFNGAGAVMATNDNHTLVASPTTPSLDAKESVLDVILPPGGYSIVISGVGATTGIALVESFELRNGSSANIVAVDDLTLAMSDRPSSTSVATVSPSSAAFVPEFCVAPVTVVRSATQ